MTSDAAPGVIAGCISLVLAVGAMLTGAVWMAGAAGAAGLLAGLSTLGLAVRLRRSRVRADEAAGRAERADVEGRAMAARAARWEAEAREARRHTRKQDRPAEREPVGLERVTDAETGLFNQVFFAVTLDKRVSAARRALRPLSLALLEPVTGLDRSQATPAVGRPVVDSLLHTLRDSDIACRLDAGLVALILEDTSENGAVWTVERVRRRLAEGPDGVFLRAGVACYPAHAFDPDALLEAAHTALRSARDWQQDRIEVALVPED